MRTLFLLISLTFVWNAQAVQNLPSPEDLLNQAAQGRIPLREVLFQIEKNAPEFTRLEELDKYMVILPRLQTLAVELKLDEIYPKAVPRLGETLFSAAMKWLDVRTIPQERLLFYAGYANYDLAFRFSDTMEAMMASETEQRLLMIGADNLEALRLFFAKNIPNSASLDASLRKVISDLAAKYIAQPAGVTNEQVNFWIMKLSLGSSFLSTIDFLGHKVALLKRETSLDSHIYLSRLLLLNSRMSLFAAELGAAMFGALGDQIVETLTRMFTFEVTFAEGEIEGALQLLLPKNIRTLAQNFMIPETPPSTSYIPSYIRAAKILLAKLSEMGLAQEAKELTNYVQRMLMPAQATALDLEGEYAVKDQDGKDWVFTIIEARKNTYFAAIGARTLDTFKSFLNLTSDFVNGGFLASEREPDHDARHNFTSHLDVSFSGDIEIEDHQSFNTLKNFRGKKRIDFPKFKPDPNQSPVATSHWVGKVQYTDGAQSNCSLDITVFPAYSLGRLNLYDNQGKVKAFLDYGIGGKINDNTFSLTTGQMISTNWNHLRGEVINDEINAVMIVGGRGVISKKIKLKRDIVNSRGKK